MSRYLILKVFLFLVTFSNGFSYDGFAQKKSVRVDFFENCQNVIENNYPKHITKDNFGADVMFFDRLLKESYPGKDLYELMYSHIQLLKELGIGIVGINLNWREIEPNPPIAENHFYNWSDLDKLVKLCHDNELEIKLQIFPSAPWASLVPTNALNRAGPIKEARMDDWRIFIQNLVDRYDGDGVNDAFLMNFPVLKILNISSEVEAKNNWSILGGTPKQYDNFLTKTREWISEVNTSILVSRAAVNFGAAFENIREKEALNQLISNAKEEKAPELQFFMDSIREEDEYDLLPVQLNYDYTGIPMQLKWIREILNENGYSKPIYGNHMRTTPVIPQLEAIMAETENPLHAAAKRLYFQLQAIFTIKKLTVGLACNLNHMFVATIFDGGTSLTPNLKKYKGARELSWAFTGIFYGESIIQKKKPSEIPKPIYYAYKTFIDKITGCSKIVKKLKMDHGVYAYLFMKNEKPIYVLWYDNETEVFLKEGALSRKIILPVSTEQALITHIIPDMNQSNPKTEIVYAESGTLEILITDNPIFVEEI